MKLFNLLFSFSLLLLVACDDDEAERTNEYNFVYNGSYNNVNGTWYVRCWDKNVECEECLIGKQELSCATGMCTGDGEYYEYMSNGTEGLHDIQEQCIAEQSKNSSVSNPDMPNEPSNLGVVMYMPSKWSYYQKNILGGYGYDDYPDIYFEENYKKHIDNLYSLQGLFDNSSNYYDKENIDFLSLEAGGESSTFYLNVTENYYIKSGGKLNIKTLNPNAPILILNLVDYLETTSIFTGENQIAIKSNSNITDTYNVVVEGYSDPRNTRSITDNVLNVIVYDKKQIANDRIAIILLNNPNVTPEMKTSQGWKNYLSKYLRQAVIYPPDSIPVYEVNIDGSKYSNGLYYDDGDVLDIFDSLTNKGGEMGDKVLSAASNNPNYSVLVVSPWSFVDVGEGEILGVSVRGLSYISENNIQGSIVAHELLHTTPLGDLKDVDDPVNLMYQYNNSVNILRHRTIKTVDGIIQNSQWEQLRNAIK